MQCAVDNFDGDIASLNDKISRQALAMHITRPDNECHHTEPVIPRLQNTMMTKETNYEFEVIRYTGPS